MAATATTELGELSGCTHNAALISIHCTEKARKHSGKAARLIADTNVWNYAKLTTASATFAVSSARSPVCELYCYYA